MWVKGKAVPLQARSGPEDSRNLRFPDLVTTAQYSGKVVSLMHRPPLPPRKCSWYSFLLEAEWTPGPQCDRKDFMSMKNPLTRAVIETATFRFATQRLNHCATTFPQKCEYTNNIKEIQKWKLNSCSALPTELELEIPGIYQIPCGCGKLCVGQRGRTIKTRCKEHQIYMRLHQPEKSAVHVTVLRPGWHLVTFSEIKTSKNFTSKMDSSIGLCTLFLQLTAHTRYYMPNAQLLSSQYVRLWESTL